ncbi:MAG: ABC transporter substrate-binding protein [Proteobacteria bacterium]|nr:ABC transporter substrate-binding protein [Pseudomonadota bacterium]MDA1357443.1 ABC transporter substrate-binding protein [Pseudomonadota bacterium]
MHCRLFVVIFTALWLVAGSASQADESPASAVVDALHASLLTMMKDADALGFDGRREHMVPVVAQSFDLKIIAAMATGPNWNEFSEIQQEQLIEALERLSLATYAARFNGYSGERFQLLSEQPAPQGAVFVNTELIKPDGEAIALKYLLHLSDAGWRILDIYFLGVYSELGMRRSEYAAVLKRDGFEGLLSSIDQKAADYAAGLLK